MIMQVLSVDSRQLERAFLDFPRRLYRNDPNYVVAFDSEIEKGFDRSINPYFKHGDAVRWIAVNEKGETVGRIAAFIDARLSKKTIAWQNHHNPAVDED